MKFKSNIGVQAGIEDNNDLTGDSGQILSSTGSGVAWIDQNAIGAATDFVFFNVKNETGSTILKGKGVMAVGTDGNSGHILIDEMVADGTVESKYFLGVLEEDIPNGGFARVISFGQLSQFDTRGQNGETWNDGQILWCDPANPGDFTITEPDGPNVKIAAAFIVNSSTNGKIQVRVQANEGIHDLHDTKITSQVDGDVLVWDNTTGVWFNDSTLNVDYTNGRVGIGTTDPLSNLQVGPGTTNAGSPVAMFGGAFSGVLSALSLVNTEGNTAAGNGTALDFHVNPGYSPTGRIATIAETTSTPAALSFYTYNSGLNEKMRITSGGNVGIGTTTFPTTDIGERELLVQGAIVSKPPGVDDYYSYLKSNWSADDAFELGIQGADVNHKLITTSNYYYGTHLNLWTSDQKRLVIDSIGNVGIGTTSPGAKLDVSGGALRIKNVVSSSSTNSELRRNINIASFTSGGVTNTGKLIIKTPVMTSGAMGKFKISGWQYDESWDLTVSGYLRIGTGRGWQQIGGAVLTGNAPFNVDQVRLCYNDTTNIFYIILGDASTFWDYYTAIVIDADNYYLDTLPTTGWDMSVSTTDPSGLTSDVTLTNIAQYGSTDALIPGNVGIGTTSPGSKLEVFGAGNTIRLDSDANESKEILFRNVGTGVATIKTDGDLKLFAEDAGKNILFNNNGGERMRITSGGTLLLGDTAVPTESVWKGTAVFGQTGTDKVIVGHLESSTDGAIIGGHNADLNAWAPLNIDGTELRFNIEQSRKMTMDSDGNLGIGTTSPSTKLNVDGSIKASNGIVATGNDVTGYSGHGLEIRVASGIGGVLSYDRTASEYKPLSLIGSQTSFQIGTDTKMFINSSGNVGIGTTNPRYQLDLAKPQDSSQVDYIALGVNNGPPDGLGNTSGSGLIWKANYTDYTKRSAGIVQIAEGHYFRSGLAFYTNNSANTTGDWGERMRIDMDGNVGIGTTSPGEKLEILGNIRLRQSLSNAETVYISTNSRGGGTNDADLRLGNSNSGDVLTVHNANVGIGTTSPSEKLNVDGNILATGTILGSNLSGTNTGDQDLSGYLLNTTDNFTGTLTISTNLSGTSDANRGFTATKTTLGAIHVSGGEGGVNGSADTTPMITIPGSTAGQVQGGIYASQNASTGTSISVFTTDSYSNGPKQTLTILDNGNVSVDRGTLSVSGTIAASNFSGTSSGTNTGDQDLSGYSLISDTPLFTFDSTANLAAPDAESGTWTDGGVNDWGNPRIGTSVAVYNDDDGQLEFNVPTGIKTAYLSHLTWSSGGYLDVYGKQADGDLIFLRRINTKQSIENSNHGNIIDHDGSTIAFIGHVGDYPSIRIINKSGRAHLTGLGWSKSELVASEGTGIVNYAQLTGTVPTWNQDTTGNAATATLASDSNLLDGYDHTQFTGVLARYGTTAASSSRIRITTPFNTNSGKMFSVDITMYAGYAQYRYTISGYMYSSINNWYDPKALFSGDGTPDIYVGRDSNGKAYISIANGNYTGIVVNNFVGGYYSTISDAYTPWTITLNNNSEDSVAVNVIKQWNNTNDGSGSGLDADTLDGQHASDFATTIHNHDDRYYTEPEIDAQNVTLNETLASLNGWVPGFSNADDSSLTWDRAEDALRIKSDSDSTIGAVYKAMRVKEGMTIRFTVTVKGDVAGSDGLYLRLEKHDGDMPDGKTHVSHDASGSSQFVQEDDSEIQDWYENSAISTDWVTHEKDVTIASDGYISLLILNWVGNSTNSIWVKTPDIQIVKAGDSDKLDGINSTSFLRSDADDVFTGNLTTGADNHITFGPNTSWGSSLRVGGNGRTATGNEMASVVTTDGNLHLDAADDANSIYLNYYAGTSGVMFGNGADGIVARMDAVGNLYKATSTSNVTETYWHSGNDGSGSGLDADTLDGQQASAFLTSLPTHNHDERYFRRFYGTAAGVSNAGFTTAFTVNGGDLASSIRMSVQGTTNSVVVSNLVDIVVNHSEDIMIKSLSGVYTKLTLKVVSNNNEDFAVELKTNSANAVNLSIEVLCYGAETVTFTNSHSYTGSTLEKELPAGECISGTGGNNGNSIIDGNVGIGTNDPSEKLEVVGNVILDAASTRLKLKGGVAGTNSGIDWTFNTDSTQYARIELDYDTRASTGLLIDSGYPMTLDYSSGSFSVKKNGSSELTILNGNVGIGTTTPAGRLELNGSGQSWSTAPGIRMWDSFNSKGWFVGSANNVTAGDFYIRTLPEEDTNPGSSQQEFTIKHASGNVGIGTTSPSYRLQLGVSGGLSDSIRIGDYSVAKNTRQYIGYARADTGLFETSSSGNTPFSVLAGVSGIRIVNTEGTVTSSQADQSVQLLTHIYNGNSRVALHANYDGNIGIGTTDPSNKLEIVGPNALRIHDGTDQGSIFFRGDRDDVYIKESSYQLLFGAPSGMLFELDTNNNDGDVFNVMHRGSSRMYINGASGNVGIGTTSPSAKLDVVGPSNGDVILRLQRDGVSNFDFFVSDAGEGNSQLFQRANTTDTGFIFQTKNSIGTSINAFTIAPSGNVGIGTTSPATALHIKSATEGMLYLDSSGDTASLQFRDNGDIRGLIGFSNGSSIYTGADNHDMVFRSEAKVHLVSNVNNHGITISAGNVGINTTSPDEKLEVVGSLKVGNIKIQNAVTGRIGFNRNTSTGAIYNSNYSAYQINGPTTSTGSLDIQSYSSTGSYLGVVSINSGNVTANNFILSSDETLKENIKDLDVKVDAKWRSYKFKDSEETRYGVIAQELEETNPELVRTNDEGLKSVAYVDLLIAKIAELEARLEKAGL